MDEKFEEIFSYFIENENFYKIVEIIKEKEKIVFSQIPFSLKSYLLSCFIKFFKKPILFISANLESAETLVCNLEVFRQDVLFFTKVSDIFKKTPQEISLVVTTSENLEVKLPLPENFFLSIFKVEKGEKIKRDELIKKFIKSGFKRVDYVENIGEFAVRGGIIDFYSPNCKFPVRIELSEDTVESLRFFEVDTQLSFEKINEIKIHPFNLEDSSISIFDYINFAGIFTEDVKFLKEGFEFFDLNFFYSKPKNYQGKIEEFLKDLRFLREKKVYLFTEHKERFKNIFSEENLKIEVIKAKIPDGFVIKSIDLYVFSDPDIFSLPFYFRKIKVFPKKKALSSIEEIKPNDYVVHIDCGIGIYEGIKRIEVDNKKMDYLSLKYAGEDRLYVPVDRINRLQKYEAISDTPPKLNSLSGSAWEWTKRKVREKVKIKAKELLELYLLREKIKRPPYSPDTLWQKELEESFPYPETEDQKIATMEIKKDMESEKPMDRLLLGDVGFGKTEVAIRAAFKCIMEGKQVAFLTPTTILAQQHYNTIKERFAPYPINVELLNRFRSKKEQKEIIEMIKTGFVDLVVGTHRLLSKDVVFKNLGLLIIDEEQKFGVAHKEKFKKINPAIDVLTLTATPIPRTLYISLLKIREMSIIETPPQNRLAIETYLLEYSEDKIREAVEREVKRGGQVYYVHNRIEDIEIIENKLKNLFPHLKIAVVHGRLPTKELEEKMLDFLEGKYEILLCTTIIENGIDIPRVNTIIIEDADEFGLSQLYQLRGRVGRSDRLAYCYLFYRKEKSFSKESLERLLAIKEFTELGSSYQLAKRDLEIRGAGNFLGYEQSGFISSVGFQLYCELLSEEISHLKGEKVEEREDVLIDIPCNAYIPEDYIPDYQQRIMIYFRLGNSSSEEELQKIRKELEDRFGKIPESVENLFSIIKIKLIARKIKVKSIEKHKNYILLRFKEPQEDGKIKIIWPKKYFLKKERIFLETKEIEEKEYFTLLYQTLKNISCLPVTKTFF
jgi:transcription-repair coupling factor (superfamily II helicase)